MLLAENPVSWFVTLLVCLLFLLPIYFKYKVRNLSAVIFKIQEQNEPEIIRLREELIKIYPLVFDMCAEKGYNMTGRDHIIAFDTKRGV